MTDVIYGIVQDELVLARRADAEWNAALWRTFGQAESWGELRDKLGVAGYERLVEEAFQGDLVKSREALPRIVAHLNSGETFEERVIEDGLVREFLPFPPQDTQELSSLLLIDIPAMTIDDELSWTDVDIQKAQRCYTTISERSDGPILLAHWRSRFDLALFENSLNRPFSDHSPFDPEFDIPGYDADYPRMLEKVITKWLPKDILVTHADLSSGMTSGTWHTFPRSAVPDIINELEDYGFHCEQDEQLLYEASGLE